MSISQSCVLRSCKSRSWVAASGITAFGSLCRIVAQKSVYVTAFDVPVYCRHTITRPILTLEFSSMVTVQRRVNHSANDRRE